MSTTTPKPIDHPATGGLFPPEDKIIGSNDLQHVEQYDGTLGVTKEFVRRFSPATVRLRFNRDLSRYQSAGNVAGATYGSGTLVGPNLVLTAAHVLREGDDAVFPLDNQTQRTVGPAEAATIMHCQFNAQLRANGTPQTPVDVAIVELVEYQPGGLDVALLRIEESPGERFNWIEIGERSPRRGEPICIIQHPRGNPKMIEAGSVHEAGNRQISYSTIDTQGGSSGSGVLDRLGRLVAVHVAAAARPTDLRNFAVPIRAALAQSARLREAVSRSRRLDVGGDRDAVVTWAADPDRNGFDNVGLATLSPTGAVGHSTESFNHYQRGHQLRPRVASAGSDVVVVWEDDPDENDFANLTIAGARSGNLTWGPHMVHKNGAGQQLAPSVAADSRCNNVVVWQDDVDRNGWYNILGRGFDTAGRERITEFQVNESGSGDQLNPVVAMSRSGNFVVAWEDDRQRTGLRSIYGRRFRADGTPHGGDIHISSTRSEGQQLMPTISISPDGALVAVAWEDDSDENSFFNVRFRVFRFDSGTDVLSPRIVHTNGSGQQRSPSIAINDAGETFVAWEDDVNRNGLANVRVRALRRDGSEHFRTTAPRSRKGGSQRNPALTLLGDDVLVVAMEEDRSGDGWYTPHVTGMRTSGERLWSSSP